jgi:membrane associated rhomboid family serine protease
MLLSQQAGLTAAPFSGRILPTMDNNNLNDRINRARERLRFQFKILLGCALLLWAILFVNTFLLGNSLLYFGVRPREIDGLWGILLMPFLHANAAHAAANTVPFLTLGWLVMARRTADFFVVSGIIMLIGGAGVWLLGPGGTVHVGASGLVFGYFGFLLLRGYFERSFTAVFISFLVILFNGGMLWGVLPQQGTTISWQGHLFGFIGGGYAAFVLSRQSY